MLIKKPIFTWFPFLPVGSLGKLAAPPHELLGQAQGWCGRQAQEEYLLISEFLLEKSPSESWCGQG